MFEIFSDPAFLSWVTITYLVIIEYRLATIVDRMRK